MTPYIRSNKARSCIHTCAARAPVTTEMVAKELKVSWNTAQIHLLKLMAEGLVKGKRVGRQNQWMTNKGKDREG